MSGPTSNNSTSPSNDSQGGGLVSAAGLGGAFLFVLLIIVLRGGKRLVVEGLDQGRGQQQVAPAQVDRFSDQSGADWLAGQFQREENFDKILACQTQHDLSDNELNAVLQALWKDKNKDGKIPPWQMAIIGTDWRLTVDWDTAEVEQAIQRHARDAKDAERAAENEGKTGTDPS